jgi:ribonuclease D
MSGMITTAVDMAGFLDGLAGRAGFDAGFDFEADNLHRYAEQLCLVQVSDGTEMHLIDPLEIDDLSALGKFLERSTIWLHGADFDMRLMMAEFDHLPHLVLDTQIAARLLGVDRFSYANLVERFFGVELSKSSQKENWGQRPLPEKMCEYARNDVRYLLPLADKLVADLHEKGRHHWFIESCEAAMAKVRDRDAEKQDPWRIQGSGKLNPRALCFLRALWGWRDEEARRWDRPPFMVGKNKQLIDWAHGLALGQKQEWPRSMRSDRRARLHAALDQADAEAENEWPARIRGNSRRWEASQEEKYKEFAGKRDKVAEGLGIEPSLLAPRAVIEQLVWEELDPGTLLLNWQRELLGV